MLITCNVSEANEDLGVTKLALLRLIPNEGERKLGKDLRMEEVSSPALPVIVGIGCPRQANV